ncbi:MAG: endonuclease/exonuclease/phosphatase family protein [Bacillus sp. (in: Bacteria)]|nr:endonuclease/exonuclease/phosphatase family protein [Bacillus sp. (in: firmicutes)]
MSYKTFLYTSISFLVAFSYYLFHVQINEKFMVKQTVSELHQTDEYITAVTYNIQYGKGQSGEVNLAQTIKKLQSLDAQIISLQEVERYSIRSHFQDQVKLLANSLDMHAAFYPSLTYPGLYYGNVVLSKYPIKEVEIVHFPSSKETRTAVITKVEWMEGELIYVVNTHLGLNQRERLLAIEKIYSKVTSLDGPVLVMGDLNAVPSAGEYQLWDDVLTKSNDGTPLVTYYRHNWQIDYIFHSREFQVIDTYVAKSEVSDHYPLIGVFLLNSTNATNEISNLNDRLKTKLVYLK